MKIQYKFLVVFFFVISVFFVPPHVFAFRAEPLPYSPTNKHDSFNNDLFSGGANYSYSIPIPKGTDGLTPNVSLDYSSLAAHDFASETGFGWQLQRDFVERDTNYTPGDSNDDKFRMHFQGGTYDLIYVSSENRYHTKIETFLNIQKLSGATNHTGEYWQVITKDGTKYRFGNASQSDVYCNDRGYTMQWDLDLIQDIHGNQINYTYTQYGNISSLSKIEYNTEKQRVIDFVYNASPYLRYEYIKGCQLVQGYRLISIQVKNSGNLVRQFDLSYINPSSHEQLLQSITEKGADGTSTLPTTTFTYKSENRSWNTTPALWLNGSTDVLLDSSVVKMGDVNGDGLLDIVKTTWNNGNVLWDVLLNKKDHWDAQFTRWGNGISEAPLGDPNVRLMDVTGDNLPDVIRTHNLGGGAVDWIIWRNTGTGFNTQPEYWLDGNHRIGDIHLDQTSTTLTDVTGDGLPDIVHTWWDNQLRWDVYKNTGSTWASTGGAWNYATTGQGIDDNNIRLIDVNGDGLPDIVKSVFINNHYIWYAWYNTGTSWSTSQITWFDSTTIDARLENSEYAVSDVNGDGLPDIIRSIGNGTSDIWKVLLNEGNGWATSWGNPWIDSSSNVDVDASSDTVILADVNGDGLPDLVKSLYENGYVWKVYTNNGYALDALDSVTTSSGATISYEYKSSTSFANIGNDSIPDLSFSLWTIWKMTQDNGISGSQRTNDITTYSYANGLFNFPSHEFRGFGKVDQVDPNGTKKQFIFNQSDAWKGKLAQVTVNDSQDNPYSKTENTWSNAQVNGVYTVNLAQEKNYTYDGGASNSQITENNYFYDTYGNLIEKIEKGDTSITTDDRYSHMEYVYNTSAWIVNTPKHTYKNASDDTTKVSESWFYYDGHTGLDDTPTKGDMTKEVKWLSGGTNPVTLFAYDSYGNQTSVTDPNSHTTSVSFGTTDTTHTYPDSTTNAKNQTTTFSYDLGTGNLLSKTDPNGFATTYSYDVFGRLTKEIQPYDSSTYPTTSYAYTFDGAAPETTLVSKRKVSGAAGTLDSYSHVDGLGRTIQTRTDAEDTSKQIVVDTFYDPNGQVKKTTVPHLDTLITSYAVPLSGITATQISYDAMSRPTLTMNPDSTTRTTDYNHWVNTLTNERGKTVKRYFNAFGKITKVDETNGATTYTTNYVYDPNDQLTRITDNASHNFDFAYDTLGRKTSQIDPDLGTWSYTYDGAGNLLNQTDNRNITTVRTYDELNRVTLINYPTDTDTSYTYDGTGKIGALASVTDAAGSVTYSYDTRLRKIQEQRTIGSTTKTTQFSYDAANRTVTQTNPDNEVVTYAFNPQGEINAVTGASTIISNIDYNALGKITKKDFANGLTTNYTYNSTDFRLNRIQTGSLQDINYTYDATGNVSSINDALTTKTQSFGYDDVDRLKTASESASGYNYAYQYDSLGNLTKFTNSGVDSDYTYGGASAGPHAMTASTGTGGGGGGGGGGSSPLTVRSSSHASATSGTAMSVAAPAGVQAGDLVLVFVHGNNQTTIADNNGSTAFTEDINDYKPNTSHGQTVSVFTRRIQTGDPTTYNFTLGTSGRWSIVALAIQNPNASTIYDISPNTANNGDADGTSLSTPTITTATDGALHVAMVGFDSGSATVSSTPSGYTAVTESNQPMGVAYKTLATAGATGAQSFAFSGDTSSMIGISLAIKPTTTTQSSSSPVAFRSVASTAPAVHTNLTINAPSGIANNDILIATVSVEDDVTVTAPSGWTLISTLDNAAQPMDIYTYWKRANNESGSYTWTHSSAGSSGAIAAYSGAKTTGSPLDATATTNQGSSSSLTGTGLTTVSNGSMLILAGNLWVWSHTATPPSGMTERVDNTNTYLADQSITTAGATGNKVATLSGSDDWEAVLIALAPEPAAPSPTSTPTGTPGGTTTYTYDANGNMTSDSTNCFEYNEANQLRKVKKCSNNQTIAEYIYDYNGNRMVKLNYTSGTLSSSVYSWTDSFETKVNVGGTTDTTVYYFANGQLIAKKNPDGTRYYVHSDHLGSTNVVTNSSGSVVETTQYDPWGEVKTGGTKSKFLYTGQEKDTETGLNYYNFRYYNSAIRRFTQPDDVIPDQYKSQDLNRYSYVKNNPLRYTDPTGHCVSCLMFLGGGISLLGLEIGGGIDGAINSSDKSFGGRVMSGLAGAQTAVESPAGELAFNVAFLGAGILAEGGGISAKDNIVNEEESNIARTQIRSNNSTVNNEEVSSVKIDAPYKRPNNATNAVQKQAVQGQPCSGCGKITDKMYANHKYPLVKEYYETGKINLNNMRSLNAVDAHCPTCSNQQGGMLSGYSKVKAASLGLKR